MGINRIKAMVNAPWAMEPSALDSLLSVFDSKLNGDLAYEAMVALTADTPFGRKHSSGFEAFTFENLSKTESFTYIKVSGTLVPRTGTMQPYCGMTPTIGVASFINSVSTDNLILHADTGGGQIIGMPELNQSVIDAKDRGVHVIGYSDTICASAGYWMLCNADMIVGSPSSLWGSIGVISAVTKKVEDKGEKTYIFQAGKQKAYGAPSVEMTKAENDYFQGRVSSAYEIFTADVAKGRNVDVSLIKATEAGIFEAKDTKLLVDKTMTLDALIKMSVEGEQE